MDSISKILNAVPFFRHCSLDELEELGRLGRTTAMKTGREIDLKKTNSFVIVVSGIFEIEALGKTDMVFLAPGSFLGSLPFTYNRHRGIIKARTDSVLVLFQAADIYKFMLGKYKIFRGYLRSIGRMGFEVDEAVQKKFGKNTRIICVTGPIGKSGKSLAASVIATHLSEKGKTIVLDCTCGGESVFSFFGRAAPHALSNRSDGGSSGNIIDHSVVKSKSGVDLLNVSFGSKVQADSKIISPLLFILSKDYAYVVIDCGSDDEMLQLECMKTSDRVVCIARSRKEITDMQGLFEKSLRAGQRAFYAINEFYSGAVSQMVGGYILPSFGPFAADNMPLIKEAAQGIALDLVQAMHSRSRVLVCQTSFIESIFLYGFFRAAGKDFPFDMIYSSGISYAVAALYLVSDGAKEYDNAVHDFFRERLPRCLDVTFPESHVFKNTAVLKYASETAGQLRSENFKSIPVAMLGENGVSGRRLVSAGFLKEAMASSFLLYPLFEGLKLAGNEVHSGYPFYCARVEDMLRTDADEIHCLMISAKKPFALRDQNMVGFYSRYLDSVERCEQVVMEDDLADSSFAIEHDDGVVSVKKAMEISVDKAAPIYKKCMAKIS